MISIHPVHYNLLLSSVLCCFCIILVLLVVKLSSVDCFRILFSTEACLPVFGQTQAFEKPNLRQKEKHLHLELFANIRSLLRCAIVTMRSRRCRTTDTETLSTLKHHPVITTRYINICRNMLNGRNNLIEWTILVMNVLGFCWKYTKLELPYFTYSTNTDKLGLSFRF